MMAQARQDENLKVLVECPIWFVFLDALPCVIVPGHG